MNHNYEKSIQIFNYFLQNTTVEQEFSRLFSFNCQVIKNGDKEGAIYCQHYFHIFSLTIQINFFYTKNERRIL